MPRRRSMGRLGKAGGSGVLLGHLTELVVTSSAGRGDKKLGKERLSGLFLAWIPKRKQLAIVRKASGASPGRLTDEDQTVFRRFHQSATRKASAYEWPDPIGLRPVGLVRSLTYVVPNSIDSPGKRGVRWVHAFGDHGEHGHGEHRGTPVYPTSLMPSLCKDPKGNLHIVRRAGNKFNVTEWIYW